MLSPESLDAWARAAASQVRRSVGRHLGARPAAAPGVALEARVFSTWKVLDHVLAARPDVTSLRRGAVLDVPPPTTAFALRAFLGRGIGVVVRRAERHHPALRSLADAFGTSFGGDGHVTIFATPQASHGFGWHYDAEEAFILQTDGAEEYFFRANTTVSHDDIRRGVLAFDRIPEETSPVMTTALGLGDILYLPTGMWRTARCRAHASLAISVGVTTNAYSQTG